MQIFLHPAVLSADLAGLLIWAWSIVSVVPGWCWLVWMLASTRSTAFASRHGLRR